MMSHKCAESLKCLLSSWEMLLKKKKTNIPEKMTIKAVAAIKSKHLSWHKSDTWDRNQTTIFFQAQKTKWNLSPFSIEMEDTNDGNKTVLLSFNYFILAIMNRSSRYHREVLVMIATKKSWGSRWHFRTRMSAKEEFIAIFTLCLVLLLQFLKRIISDEMSCDLFCNGMKRNTSVYVYKKSPRFLNDPLRWMCWKLVQECL